MASHVVNPYTKFEDPAAIRSRVMGSDISHKIPLTMRLQELRGHAMKAQKPATKTQMYF